MLFRSTRERLELAGWLSMVSAIITIPLAVFQLVTAAGQFRLISTVLSLLGVALFVYLFALLRELLNREFDFHETDRPISLLIFGNVGLFILGLLDDVGPKNDLWDTVTGIVAGVAAVALGILFILFSIRLLRLGRSLFGYLKPFCYTNIGVGVCLASIILFPLSIVASMVADVVLGLIFFAAARQRVSRWD